MSITINAKVAMRLEEVARLLDDREGNQFRARAYRRGAETLRGLKRPIDKLIRTEGMAGLRQLPGIGKGLARSINELVVKGRLPLLERLQSEVDPIATLTTAPGIGTRLAGRLHSELGVNTLEELEAAAHDGRLARLGGFGSKRIAAIQEALATRLGRARRPASKHAAEPQMDELLDVDREYREKAVTGKLKKIAPRRFNPSGAAWLPVLRTRRGKRHYTALFSNTARAHELGKTRDWVVLYYDGETGEQQHTVVTAQKGPLAGRRVVRGRETECAAFYSSEKRKKGE